MAGDKVITCIYINPGARDTPGDPHQCLFQIPFKMTDWLQQVNETYFWCADDITEIFIDLQTPNLATLYLSFGLFTP